MDLKYPTRESAGNGEFTDSHSLEKVGEISLLETGYDNLETGDDNLEPESVISPFESTGENCDGKSESNDGESEKARIGSENGTTKKPLKHRKATIMVAGRARNGKSTALNNVFELDLVAKTSATSVTQVVNVSEVTKMVPLPKPKGEKIDGKKVEEIKLKVIDTPGLGATDIAKENILKDMRNIVQGEDYTLMYCFCVAPNQNVAEIDENIVKYLQQSLGKEVWNKCVLLLTFSDYARVDFDDSKEYIKYIKGHANEFQKILNKIDPTNTIVVKTIFDYQSPEELEQDTNPSEIIAIPVNKKPQNSKSILPGMLRKGQDWTEIVFVELMKKTPEEERTPFVLFRYPNVLLGTSSAGVGALLGAFIGGAVGAVAGPLGMTGGAYAGAAIGAFVVTATGLATKTVYTNRKQN